MWRFFSPILKYSIGHTCLRKEINFLFGMTSQMSAHQAAPDRCWNISSLAPQKTIFSVGLFSIFRKANIDAAKPQLLQTDLQNFWQISISCFAPLKLSMYNAHHLNSNGSVRIWGKKHKLFEIEIECEFAAEMIVRAVSWLVWFHVNVLTKDTLLKNILMRSFCFDVFPVLKCCFISLKYKMCCNNYNGRTGDDHLLGIQTPETLRKGGMKKNFTECMTNGKTCTISQVELSSRRHF